MTAAPDADPEPATVAVGEPGWVRNARLADILTGEAADATRAHRLCDELLASHPGVTLVAVALPDDLALLTTRDAQRMVVRLPPPCPESAARRRVALAAAVVYSWLAATAGWPDPQVPAQARVENPRPR